MKIAPEILKELERVLGYVPELEHIKYCINRCKKIPPQEMREELAEKEAKFGRSGQDTELAERIDELKIVLTLIETVAPKMERKIKAKVEKDVHVSPAVIGKLRRQRKCYDSSHAEEIFELKNQLMKVREDLANERIAKEEILGRQARMIDKDLAEEVEKTAYSRGLHAGQDEEIRKKNEEIRELRAALEARLKSELGEATKLGYENGFTAGAVDKENDLKNKKACFKEGHALWEGMIPVRLNMPEVISLFEEMSRGLLSNAGGNTIPVLLKDGVKPKLSPRIAATKDVIDEYFARKLGKDLRGPDFKEKM